MIKHLILFTFFIVTMQETGKRVILHSADVKKMSENSDRCGTGSLIFMMDYNTFCVDESIEKIYNQVK